MSRLDFHVLGSGCFAPAKSPKDVRNPSGYVLDRGKELLLFDFGFGGLRQMVRAGLDPEKVSHVFLSHRHPDHVGDLPALLFHFRYDAKPEGGVLRLCGPRGFRGFMRRLTQAHHPWLRPRGFKLVIEECEEGDVVKGTGWRVHCREVPHTTESLAFRYVSETADVCYSGDTAYDAGLAEFASGADLFALECTLGDGERAEGHLRVSEALDLARRSKAKRVLFTHLSPASEKGLAKVLRGSRMRSARDLLRVRLAS